MKLQRILIVALCTNLLVPLSARAGSCADDISSVDKALRSQYGEDRAWWQFFACPIVMDGKLRKDAIVNTEQIKEISYFRNIAYMQHARGDDNMCRESLKLPKRMLRIW
jgi:hypothetical protein